MYRRVLPLLHPHYWLVRPMICTGCRRESIRAGLGRFAPFAFAADSSLCGACWANSREAMS